MNECKTAPKNNRLNDQQQSIPEIRSCVSFHPNQLYYPSFPAFSPPPNPQHWLRRGWRTTGRRSGIGRIIERRGWRKANHSATLCSNCWDFSLTDNAHVAKITGSGSAAHRRGGLSQNLFSIFFFVCCDFFCIRSSVGGESIARAFKPPILHWPAQFSNCLHRLTNTEGIPQKKIL